MQPYHHVATGSGQHSLTVFLDGGDTIIIGGDHPHFDEILAGAQGDASPEELQELADLSQAVAKRLATLSERVKVSDGRVYFDGDEVENALTRQIVRCLDAGLDDWRPLVRFMENLAANPQTHSREMLFDWIGERDFTITDEGYLVAYKGVAEADGEWVSVHRGPAIVDGQPVNGAVPNRVGSVVEIGRSEVAFDPGVGCSTGLHVGTFDYAKGWAQGALLRVIVNPRDVVSVPTDCEAQKMRVCRYKVAAVIDAPDTRPVADDDEDFWEG